MTYKRWFSVLLISTVVTFCTKQKEKKTELKELKTIVKKDTLKKTVLVEKQWDSLNRNNVNAFFKEFGKQHKATKVVIKTAYGDMKFRLYRDTPIHRANFLFLTKIKYFNTTVFYRVAPNFVIQGGNSDETKTMKQRQKYGNYHLEPEFRKNRRHKYGALAAARDYDDNPKKLSSPFEFYVVHNKRGNHHLNNEHTVFGELIAGFDTMDAIANLEASEDEWPFEKVSMKVEIID